MNPASQPHKPTAAIPEWRDIELPPEVLAIPSMLLRTERQLLFGLARDHFRNDGQIIDAGSFLGGSTASLGAGVLQNQSFKAKPQRLVITSYDLFKVWGDATRSYFPDSPADGVDYLDQYLQNIDFLGRDLVDVRVGDITKSGAVSRPIEILFIDVAKNVYLNDWIVYNFFPQLIPGHSVVVQQDYLFTSWNAWLHVTMEQFADYFEMVDYTETNSVAFLYTNPIPQELLVRNVVGDMRRSKVVELQDRAIGRFDGKQRDILRQSRQHLHSMLDKWAE